MFESVPRAVIASLVDRLVSENWPVVTLLALGCERRFLCFAERGFEPVGERGLPARRVAFTERDIVSTRRGKAVAPLQPLPGCPAVPVAGGASA